MTEQFSRLEEGMRANTRSRPPPLPSFNFGSGSPTNIKSQLTSPRSLNSPVSPAMPIPTRPGGHRRGGSEFIGGDGTTGTGTLLSTSPINKEADLPTPSSAGPPAGRRGHAHRRSAAISCHDLSMMLKPPVASSSAPTSPSDSDYKRSSFPNTIDATLNSKTHHSQPSSPERLTSRARVGFSDTLEFIPRPLSLATSESSSTLTTRQGHSVSGSLSSIVSTNAASRSSKDIQRYPSPTLLDRGQSVRPKTAGAILVGNANNYSASMENTKPKQATQVDASSEKTSTPTTPRFPGKKFIFFGHESNSGEASPTMSRPTSSNSGHLPATTTESLPSETKAAADAPISSVEIQACRQRRSSSITKKPKKAKKWSILPRKTRSRSSSLKQQKSLSRRSPTPPLRHYQPLEVEPVSTDTMMMKVDESTIVRPQLQTDIASWRPRQVMIQDEDSMSPIIDLDAALGPFNTPTGRDLEWEASQRGSGLRKRRMHSAAGINGLGTPYHRRAESAPQMAAFENPRMSIHHLGSSSTMADVFEEDEEDEWEETKSVSHKGSKSELDEEDDYSNVAVEVVDAVDMHSGKSMDWTVEEESSIQRGIKRKSSGLSDSERRQVNSSLGSEKSTPSLEDPVQEDVSAVTSVENELLPPSPRSGGKGSDSTMTPPLRPSAAKNLAPVEVGSVVLQEHYLTPSSVHSEDPSPFPSPRSPFSYDAQRISTAPSSLAEDRSFHSLLLGEPGPELRMSVDGVPSLTSSSSTMTGTSNFPTNGSFTNIGFANNGTQFRDGQRSSSLSAAAVSRKRSSIASLSRLISSSHGEKSKLSIEHQAPSSPEKKDKDSRSKRLSRRLLFWKPRDAAPS